MAIFHLSLKMTSRGKGKSAVAAAAYRAGMIITNEYDGVTHDYSRKSGIVHTEIMLPNHAPRDFNDRAGLWNSVEAIEKAKNAQLTREVEVALPIELTREQSISLVQEYVKRNFVDKGMCADICIHDSGDGNPHAHILLTVRPLNMDGTWGSKQRKEYILDSDGNKIYDSKKKTYKCRSVESTDWNDRDNAELWRESWASSVNEYLKQNDITERVNHRSYKRQGIEQIPTIHLGTTAHQLEKRGIRTERGDTNRKINEWNNELRQLKARTRKLKNELYLIPVSDSMPSMVEVATLSLDWKNTNTQWQKIKNLKAMASTLNFMMSNGIYDFSAFAEKAESMYSETRYIGKDMTKIDRRLDTLDKHFEMIDTLDKYKKYVRKYNGLSEKDRATFSKKYPTELQAYKSATDYFAKALNGRRDVPKKMWQSEIDSLTTERTNLIEKYYDLRNDIKDAEAIKRKVKTSMDYFVPELSVLQKRRKRDFGR